MDAVLNVSDLENMLATGNLTVTTAGSGVDAEDIDVETGFSWSTANMLSLEASVGIAIDKGVSIGSGGLSLKYLNQLTFGQKGRISFQNLSSPLTVNGTAYALVNSIASLASAIESNPSGMYALAYDYDAAQDGTYNAPPIQTLFSGTFEGLGNTISRLSIDDQSADSGSGIALFAGVEEPGIIEHVRLARISVVGGNTKVVQDRIGALVGDNGGGYLFQDSATGKVRLMGGNSGAAGGLVGVNAGYVDTCFAQVAVSVDRGKGIAEVGGLLGGNGEGSAITNSFATGPVEGGDSNQTGGLVGYNGGTVENSYETGAVTGGANAEVGGFVGQNKQSTIEYAYSTGAVSGGTSSYVGGFAGKNTPRLTDAYWDTTTSGTTIGVGEGRARGITGLTTEQLQSGLPAGFDPSLWGEKSSINNGLPYLLANPPRK